MHDIWNPWHGCIKISEGCEHCYMFYLDRQRGQDGAQIRRVQNGFDMPLKKDRRGHFKIQSGEPGARMHEFRLFSGRSGSLA